MFKLGSTSSTSAVTIAGFTLAGGNSLSEFNDPYSIFVNTDGTMYILDNANSRVVKWLAGQPLGFTVAGGHGNGTTLNKIGTSVAIYLDDQENIYISEYSNNRVTKWFNGNFTAGIIVSIIDMKSFFYNQFDAIQVAGNNTAGSTLYQLNRPWGIFIDSMYGIYVVDRNNHRVQYWEKGKYHRF